MIDFLGQELAEGDKVIFVMYRKTLRKGFIKTLHNRKVTIILAYATYNTDGTIINMWEPSPYKIDERCVYPSQIYKVECTQ